MTNPTSPAAAVYAKAAALEPKLDACMAEIDACIADKAESPRHSRARAVAAFNRMTCLMAEALAVDLSNVVDAESGSPCDLGNPAVYFRYLKALDDHYTALSAIIKGKLFQVGFRDQFDILETMLAVKDSAEREAREGRASIVPGPSTKQ